GSSSSLPGLTSGSAYNNLPYNTPSQAHSSSMQNVASSSPSFPVGSPYITKPPTPQFTTSFTSEQHTPVTAHDTRPPTPPVFTNSQPMAPTIHQQLPPTIAPPQVPAPRKRSRTMLLIAIAMVIVVTVSAGL